MTRRAKAVSLCEGQRALIGVPNAFFWPDSGACIDLRGGRLSAPNLSKLAAHQSDELLLYLRIVQQTQEDLFESLVLLCLLDLVFGFGVTLHSMIMHEVRQPNVPALVMQKGRS